MSNQTHQLTARAFTAGAIASALRQNINPDVYRSTNILGADCSLAEFCDVIAEAGMQNNDNLERFRLKYLHVHIGCLTVTNAIMKMVLALTEQGCWCASRGSFRKFHLLV